jgi:hypothetical protein
VHEVQKCLTEQCVVANCIEMASQEQSKFVMRVGETTGKLAEALNLVSEQSKALTALGSELHLRETVGRLHLEQAPGHASGLQPVSDWLSRNADIAASASAHALVSVNERMRDFIASNSVGAPMSKFTSTDTKFAVSPEGHVTACAKPGGSGNVQVSFSDNDSVNVQFHSNANGQVQWVCEPRGRVACNSDHAILSDHGRRAVFNFQTRVPEVQNTGQIKQAGEQKSGLMAGAEAKIPLEIVEAKGNAEYSGASQRSHETAHSESVKMSEGPLNHGITFEVKFVEKPHDPIKIIRGGR